MDPPTPPPKASGSGTNGSDENDDNAPPPPPLPVANINIEVPAELFLSDSAENPLNVLDSEVLPILNPAEALSKAGETLHDLVHQRLRIKVPERPAPATQTVQAAAFTRHNSRNSDYGAPSLTRANTTTTQHARPLSALNEPMGREADLGIPPTIPNNGTRRSRHDRGSGRRGNSTYSNVTGQDLDYAVPIVTTHGHDRHTVITGSEVERTLPRLTVQRRLQSTLDHAIDECAKYKTKAQATGYALNIAIGMQVMISALITGLSAALSSGHGRLAIPLLGGLGTVVASYLARARGSNEPEHSISCVKDLERFIRDCEAFLEDHGLKECPPGSSKEKEGEDDTKETRQLRELDRKIDDLRGRFEMLLGSAENQRNVTPPV